MVRETLRNPAKWLLGFLLSYGECVQVAYANTSGACYSITNLKDVLNPGCVICKSPWHNTSIPIIMSVFTKGPRTTLTKSILKSPRSRSML